MKKIMFNDTYGLTQAVLEGRKTMTRRVLNLSEEDEAWLDHTFDWDLCESDILDRYAQYKVGEVVAVAQSYLEAYEELLADEDWDNHRDKWDVFRHFLFNGEDHTVLKGWKNKMFVKSEVMPNRIRITERKIERLQNISQEDCLKEGIAIKKGFWNTYSFAGSNKPRKMNRDGSVVLTETFFNPREAFARLIDKVSKKGTWKRNPWVIAYTFELVKGGQQ